MVVKFPVELDNGILIHGNEDPFDFSDNQRLNGVDNDGNRITNITGFNGIELKKWCPSCEEIYPSSEFGETGRPNHMHGRRDQSWCKKCRACKF